MEKFVSFDEKARFLLEEGRPSLGKGRGLGLEILRWIGSSPSDFGKEFPNAGIILKIRELASAASSMKPTDRSEIHKILTQKTEFDLTLPINGEPTTSPFFDRTCCMALLGLQLGTHRSQVELGKLAGGNRPDNLSYSNQAYSMALAGVSLIGLASGLRGEELRNFTLLPRRFYSD